MKFLLLLSILLFACRLSAAPVDLFWFPDGGQPDDAILAGREPKDGTPIGILFCLFSDHTYLTLKSTKQPKELLPYAAYYSPGRGYWEFRDGGYRIYADGTKPPSAKPAYFIDGIFSVAEMDFHSEASSFRSSHSRQTPNGQHFQDSQTKVAQPGGAPDRSEPATAC